VRAGYRNSNPAFLRRLGVTHALVSSSDDISPSASRSTGAGTRSQGRSGRRNAACSAAVSSPLVTGFGAVRLNGPLVVSVSSRNRMALTSSVSEIQLTIWLPSPNLGSSPNLAGSASRDSTPPRGLSTRPLRVCAMRIPAFLAGSAAASQSCTSRARNPSPAGSSSVTARPPVPPYQPMADAEMSVFGGGSALVIAVASARVASTRLALISAL
jgi:hypothetical protein